MEIENNLMELAGITKKCYVRSGIVMLKDSVFLLVIEMGFRDTASYK